MEIGDLDAGDLAVYEYLVDHPASRVDTVAADLGREAGAVRAAIDRLAREGLVRAAAADPARFSVTPPDVGLQRVVVEQEARLLRLREYVLALSERHSRSSAQADASMALIDVLRGDDVPRRVDELMLAAQREVWATDVPPWRLQDHNEPNEVEVALIGRGVRCRAIYDQAALEHPGRVGHITAMVAAGEEARVLSGTPMKLAIVDRRTAVLPGLTETFVAMVVRPSPLLDGLVSLYELLWSRATPVALGPDDRIGAAELSEAERLLLTLLAGGLTDEAIARQLQVSHRTVTRRVRELMDRLGAVNRFQAGLLAHARGWVKHQE